MNNIKYLVAFFLQLSFFTGGSFAGIFPTSALPPGYVIDNGYVPGDVAGEAIDLKSGSLTHRILDMHIPGPAGLDVDVYRTYRVGSINKSIPLVDGEGWWIEMPRVHVTTVDDGNDAIELACWSGDLVNISINGMELKPIGYSSSAIHSGAVAAFQGNYIALCEDGQKIIRDSKGISYYFGEDFSIDASYAQDGSSSVEFSYVDRISDRFGNELLYEYESADVEDDGFTFEVKRLKRIKTADGKYVVFEYDPDVPLFLNKISYSGREVQYVRSGGASANEKVLTSVIGVDSRVTEYEYQTISSGAALSQKVLKKIHLPTGAEVEYEYGRLSNISSSSPSCSQNNSCPQMCSYSVVLGYVSTQCLSASLISRHVSGVDIEDQLTEFYRDWRSPDHVTAKVVERAYAFLNNRTTEHEFIRVEKNAANTASGISALNGKKVSISMSTSSTPLYEESYQWSVRSAATAYCGKTISKPSVYKDCGTAKLDGMTTRVVRDDGVDEYYVEYENYDDYGNWLRRKSYNSFSDDEKYEIQTRHNDKVLWVIGMPREYKVSEDGSSWESVVKYNYKPWYASPGPSMLKQEYKYGVIHKNNFSYNQSGELKQVKYSGSGRYERYKDYKNGIPQKVCVPERYAAGEVCREQDVNDFGEVIRELDFNGNEVIYERENGLVTSIDRGVEWDVENIEYDFTGNFVRLESGKYYKKTYYDVLGRVKRVEQGDKYLAGSVIYKEYSYDPYGKKVFESYVSSSPLSNVGSYYIYDGLGNVVMKGADGGYGSGVWYFGAGNSYRYVDATGREVKYSFHAVGKPSYENVSRIEFLSGGAAPIDVEYSVHGNVERIAQGQIIESRSYDNRQLLCNISRPDTGNVWYGYNSQQDLAWKYSGVGSSGCISEPSQEAIKYTYDNRNDLREVLVDGVSEKKVTLDPEGNVIGIETPLVTMGYSYNSLGKLESESMVGGGANYQIYWGFDNSGNVSSLTYPNGEVVDYLPDAMGRPTKIGPYVQSIDYHPSGGADSYTLLNGVSRSVDYYSDGRIEKIVDQGLLGAVIDFSYSYDKAKNISAVEDSLYPQYSLSSVSYDGAGQVVAMYLGGQPAAFGYDQNFNMNFKSIGSVGVVESYAYDLGGRVSSVSGARSKNYSYDSRGNIINNGDQSFQYDLLGRMTSSDGDEYFYDGNGSRYKASYSDGDSYFFYSRDGKLISSFEGSSAINYIYLNGAVVAKHNYTEGGLDFFHTDALGSVVAKTDVGGVLVSESRYTPFGLSSYSGSPGQSGDIGFAGDLEEHDTGLVYMKARFYDPSLGRFYSSDPVDFRVSDATSFNKYIYAANNPLKYIDPNGESIFLAQSMLSAVKAGVAGYHYDGWEGAFIGAGVGYYTGAIDALMFNYSGSLPWSGLNLDMGFLSEPYAITPFEVVDIFYDNALAELSGTMTVGRAVGSGLSESSAFSLDGKLIGMDYRYLRGASLEASPGLEATLFSSGKIDGAYQGFSFQNIGGITVRWDYLGNWDAVFSISVGYDFSIISGYQINFEEPISIK